MHARNMYAITVWLVAIAFTCTNALTNTCDGDANSNKNSFTIPEAMSLDDFKSHFATNGVQTSELYYVYQNPPAYDPYFNYRINYTLMYDDTILETVEADELALGGGTPACIQYSTTLTPVDVDNNNNNNDETANFNRSSSTEMQTFWSSCPTKYLWTMKCRDWQFPEKVCPKSKTSLGLSIPFVGQKAPDNIPWSSVVEDLKEADMVFGSDYLFWAYTYGESTLCP